MSEAIHHLVLGGARSGKSRFAEQCLLQSHKRPLYVATAQALDDEMRSRIALHQEQRPSGWEVIEEPLELSAILESAKPDRIILIDCLTLWLTNCLAEDRWPERKREFLSTVNKCRADLVLVSNEVGSGIVPMGDLSRRFVDEIGWLHQELAQHCSKVSLIVAGLATALKDQP